MTEVLNCESLARVLPDVHRPDYDFSTLRVGIVHLGVGAFHRAHQAVYTEEAVKQSGGDWGIVGVALRHPTVPRALSAQDQLYTVETLGAEPSYRIVASIRDSLTASTQGSRVLHALSAASTHIVTMTVTEKGYCLGADGQLDWRHPDIAHDVEHPDVPISAIGWLAAGLEARFVSHREPITLVSCDNLKANGVRLSAAVASFVERTRPRLSTWLRDNVRCPQTMVDCIVPAASDASRARVCRALGVADLACVQREFYSEWVIEDRFATPRPAWHLAGAKIVDDVTDYGRLKLHVLNTSHSALAYLGLPRGHTFVREAMADPALSQFLDELQSTEIAPALAPLPVAPYWETVRTRFSNPRIDHRLSQIAEDGLMKLTERVFPLMLANVARGAPVLGLARIVRAWLATRGTRPSVALEDSGLLPESIRTNPVLRAAIAAAPP